MLIGPAMNLFGLGGSAGQPVGGGVYTQDALVTKTGNQIAATPARS